MRCDFTYVVPVLKKHKGRTKTIKAQLINAHGVPLTSLFFLLKPECGFVAHHLRQISETNNIGKWWLELAIRIGFTASPVAPPIVK